MDQAARADLRAIGARRRRSVGECDHRRINGQTRVAKRPRWSVSIGYNALSPTRYIEGIFAQTAPVLPESAEVETCHGHSVIREQIQDSGSHAWRARVSGSKAAAECPKRGYKTLYAGSEDELQATVETWLNES